jgi:hypothetical protein
LVWSPHLWSLSIRWAIATFKRLLDVGQFFGVGIPGPRLHWTPTARL